MERFQALKLIKDNLDEVVDYLGQLQEQLQPAFAKNKFGVFDVGVDVCRTSASDSIAYSVRVYDMTNNLDVSCVEDVVLDVAPNFKGKCGVIYHASYYPQDSFLGFELLKDMQKARE